MDRRIARPRRHPPRHLHRRRLTRPRYRRPRLGLARARPPRRERPFQLRHVGHRSCRGWRHPALRWLRRFLSPSQGRSSMLLSHDQCLPGSHRPSPRRFPRRRMLSWEAKLAVPYHRCWLRRALSLGRHLADLPFVHRLSSRRHRASLQWQQVRWPAPRRAPRACYRHQALLRLEPSDPEQVTRMVARAGPSGCTMMERPRRRAPSARHRHASRRPPVLQSKRKSGIRLQWSGTF